MADTAKPSVAAIASQWWRQFCDPEGPVGHGSARAFRAACRRLRTPAEAYTLEQTAALHRILAAEGYGQSDRPYDRVGLIAGLLGQVERFEADSHEKSLAAVRMGRGDPPTVSPMRFQKLIRSDVRDLMTPLRRALSQIEFKCSPGRLASDLFYWGDDVKARWCLQYYGDTQLPQISTTAPEETPA